MWSSSQGVLYKNVFSAFYGERLYSQPNAFQLGLVMKLDIHGSKKQFETIEKTIQNYPGKNGEIINKYLTWHKIQIENGSLQPSSASRSLGIALQIIDEIPNVSLLESAPIERFWANVNQRLAIRKSQGKIFNQKKKLSHGSLSKIKTQITKFYKFISFIEKYPDKNIDVFSNSLIKEVECCRFLTLRKEGVREDFTLPSQQKVKLLIEDLYKSKSYYGKMAGVVVAIANDCGLRYGEIISLKREDVSLEGDFYLLKVSQSKTAKRTVICALGKKFLDEWFKLNKKTSLVFEPLVGDKASKIVYNSLRKYLSVSAKKIGVELIPGHSFHTFRHCASSRLKNMPSNQKKYWMGWRQEGLESVYTRVGWEDCKKSYFESLKGNPMLDFSLSEFEEQQKDAVQILEESIYQRLKERLEKN